MKERKLDKLYAEFEKNYSGKSKEEMDKIISDLEKEIAGKWNAPHLVDIKKRIYVKILNGGVFLWLKKVKNLWVMIMISENK